MDVIIFEKETYWRMQRELMNMFSEALKKAKQPEAAEADWISWDEAKKILGYKSGSYEA